MARQILHNSVGESDGSSRLHDGDHQAYSERDGDQIIEEINSLIYYNDPNVIEDNINFISRSLKQLAEDKNSGLRLKFLSFVKECAPQLNQHRDHFLLKMLPHVLTRICDHKMSIARKAIRTIHFMFRSSKKAGQALLDLLVSRGLDSSSVSMQTACVLRLSMLITYRMASLDFSALVESLVDKFRGGNRHFRRSQIRAALESLEEIIGIDDFQKNVLRLPPSKQTTCFDLLSKGDPRLGRADSDEASTSEDTYQFTETKSDFPRKTEHSVKYLPDRIFRGCYDSSFHVRLESLTEWKSLLEGHDSLEMSESGFRAISRHFFAISKEKSSRILELLLQIVAVVCSRLCSPTKTMIESFLELILLDSFNKTEVLKTGRYAVIRRLNAQVSSPNRILELLNLLIRNNKAYVKKEAIDLIIYVILLNDRSETINTESLYKIIVVSALNDNSAVRHAALECLVVLHSIAKRSKHNLRRLISTIQPAELISGGAGITEAFQTRLNRNLVARLASGGALVYGMNMPGQTEGPLKLLSGKDVDWVLNSPKPESRSFQTLLRPAFLSKRRRLRDRTSSAFDSDDGQPNVPLAALQKEQKRRNQCIAELPPAVMATLR